VAILPRDSKVSAVPSSDCDEYRARPLGLTLSSDHDFDVSIQGVKETQESLYGKSLKPIICEGGDLGLVQLQQFGGCVLPQSFFLENPIDGDRQADLGQFLVRVGQLQISKHVSGASRNGKSTEYPSSRILSDGFRRS
jgi:hypothetical protein